MWMVADPGFDQGGPNFEMEGCTPDFIQSHSLLGAKQCKMYALTLGLEAQGLWGPPGSAMGGDQSK